MTTTQNRVVNKYVLKALEAHLCRAEAATQGSLLLDAIGRESLWSSRTGRAVQSGVGRSLCSLARLRTFLGVLYGGFLRLLSFIPSCTPRSYSNVAGGKTEGINIFPT